MEYLKAIEYALKQKEESTRVNEIINTLWKKNIADFITGFGESYKAVLTVFDDYYDVVLNADTTPIGFITLKYEGQGRYTIVNDTSANPHTAITDTAGHGLSVVKRYRKKGIGAALLSLGIGIVQKDYAENKRHDGAFEVVATDITKLGLGCYKHFGFVIREGMSETTGFYNDKDHVPELKILRKKVSSLKRFKKRLGMGG